MWVMDYCYCGMECHFEITLMDPMSGLYFTFDLRGLLPRPPSYTWTHAVQHRAVQHTLPQAQPCSGGNKEAANDEGRVEHPFKSQGLLSKEGD